MNDSNQCAMVRVVARHPYAYVLESLTVGFPSKEVVALSGDPSPLPPHPPRPRPLKPFPRALVEVSGHINEAHGFHLFSNCLLTTRAWCTKIEVQIANQEWVRTRGARLPGPFDISQCFQVGGGNITPDNKKLDIVYP
jgi:hypothetical protein